MVPIFSMRSCRRRTTLLRTIAPPVPSISVPPTSAIGFAAGVAARSCDTQMTPTIARPITRLINFDLPSELLVFIAFELNQLLIDDEPLIDANRPWLRVRLRIVQRVVELQMIERRPADPLRHLCLLAVRAAVDVEPSVVRAVFGAAQIVRLDDQRVAFPVSDRVPVPPGLRLSLWRQFAAIHVDVAEPVVRLVLDEDHLRVRNVHDLPGLRLLMKLQESHRQTHGVRIITILQFAALFLDLGRPRSVRQAAFHVRTRFTERRNRRSTRIVRKRRRRCLQLKVPTTEQRVASPLPATAIVGRSTVRTHPDSRQIRLAVGGSRRGSVAAHGAFRIAWHRGVGDLRPLSARRDGAHDNGNARKEQDRGAFHYSAPPIRLTGFPNTSNEATFTHPP